LVQTDISIIDYGKKFLNWLRTSCVVFITTVAIWQPEQRIYGLTSNNRQQRIDDSAIDEWQDNCGYGIVVFNVPLDTL